MLREQETAPDAEKRYLPRRLVVTPELDRWLKSESARLGVSQSALARMALSEYRDRPEMQPSIR